MFEPPPDRVLKASELRDHIKALENGRIGAAEFEAFISQQRQGIEEARTAAAGDLALQALLEACTLWSQALDQAQQWVETRNEWVRQGAMSLATRADQQLQLVLLSTWEEYRNELVSQQERLRLSGYVPPPPNQPT